MFIIPIIHRFSKCKKIINNKIEITGVDYDVDTIVTFEESIIESTSKKIFNGIPTTVVYYERKPQKAYSFRIRVHISKDEYEKNKYNQEEYVCGKAKELYEYKTLLKECLSKESNNKEYRVETFLSKEPNGRIVHTISHRYKEYITI